jgi:UPF0176 protein
MNSRKYNLDHNLKVASFYHFSSLSDLKFKQKTLLSACVKNNILGTILIAHEGINGTISGSSKSLDFIIDQINSWEEITALDIKYSSSSHQNFNRMKVRIKDEIVKMGKPDIDALKDKGIYVDPKNWNELISRKDVMVIDTRNNYETKMGQFDNAVDPETLIFSQFPEWADNLSENPNKSQKIAMYCTGGIRCEKASSYMKQIGFKEVYHLKGGILKYLEEIPAEESLWSGECFVFDDRVSLLHGLEEGKYELCYGCQEPLSNDEQQSEFYESGVSCPYCFTKLSEEKKNNLRERERQYKLAKGKGQHHLGDRSISKQRHLRRQLKNRT